MDFISFCIKHFVKLWKGEALEWYAIQTYSGSEKVVGEAIRNLIVQNQMQDRFGDVVVPTESIIETKKKIVDRSLYPGYVFIQVDLDTKLWHMIQSLPKVGRFIGESKKPTPLSEADIAKISFEQGEVVRIIDGPFVNFTGTVEEYDLEHKKLKLNVSIFGRSTPVEILYSQVEKII